MVLTRRGGAALDVAGAVEPREVFGALGLERGDVGVLLHRQADVVQAVDQAVLAELVDFEWNLLAV